MNKIILALAVLTSALCGSINALEITVLSPNGGERIQRGSEHEITWTDDIAENVSIELLKNGSLERVVSSSTESDGSYLWSTPAGLPTGDDYKLKISSTIMTSTNDLSDANFSFFSGAVEITNPCGGVIIDKGSNYNISWNDDLYENVRIELLKGGNFHSNIVYNTESDGQYEWFVSPDILQDNDYKIKIVSVANEGTYDITNNFLIRGANYITGEVSGIWKTDCSPYILGGSVTVPEDKSLTIEPGVKVQFQSPGAFNVKGNLNAVGTKENKIKFSGVSKNDYWNGLRFEGDNEVNMVNCELIGSRQSTFSKIYDDGGEYAEIVSLIETDDNGFILVGYIKNNGNSDVYIFKVDEAGNKIWEKVIGGDNRDGATSIIKNTSGNYMISGYKDADYDNNGNSFIAEMNDSGDILWNKDFDKCHINALVNAENNNVVLAGRTETGQIYAVKINAVGEILWSNNYEFEDFNIAFDVTKTSDNGYVIACMNFKILKIDENGDKIWEKEYNEYGSAYSIQQTSDLGFIVSGNNNNSKSIIVKLDENGDVLWNKNYSEGSILWCIKQSIDGGYVASGCYGGYGYYKIWLIKYDSQGNIEWNRAFGEGVNAFVGQSFIRNSNGNYTVIGKKNENDLYLLNLTSSGELITNPSAIYAKNSTNLSIQNCEISGNETSGIYLENTDAVVTNNIIRNNNDGAIKLVGSKPVITNNTIINNSSDEGGAISFDAQSSPDIMNNIIWGNSATEEGAQVYINDDESEPNFFYNNIQGGSTDFAGAGSGSNFGAQYVSNIDNDPQFAAEDKAFFYPYSLTENSPCINNGYPGMTSSNLETFNLPELDLAGNPRVIEEKIDMGAFEFFNDYQEVSGNITQDTYWFADKIKVMGDITIAAGKTLTIKHGVTVEFQGQYKIVVYGNIIADGIYDDRITFTAANENEGWNGIQFRPNSGGNSRFNSCIFRHANGEAGGSGGVLLADSTQTITISDCIVEDDEAEKNGGAIYAKDSELEIINTIFSGNKAGMNGGAIYAENSHISMLNNTIVNNSAADHGDGIMFVNSDGYIFNTIIWFNDGEQIYLDDEQSDPSFYNCNIEEGVAGFSGSGAGDQYDGTVENIISADPSFSGSKEGFEQYNLAEGSPCINSGSSFTIDTEIPEYDLAGRSRIYAHKIDIGAYEYGSNSIEDNIKDSYSWGLEQNYPNPFNPSTTITFSIPEGYESGINLLIYNVKGQVVQNIRQEKISAGIHKMIFNLGSEPTGVYYYMLKGKDFSKVKKMVLCK